MKLVSSWMDISKKGFSPSQRRVQLSLFFFFFDLCFRSSSPSLLICLGESGTRMVCSSGLCRKWGQAWETIILPLLLVCASDPAFLYFILPCGCPGVIGQQAYIFLSSPPSLHTSQGDAGWILLAMYWFLCLFVWLVNMLGGCHGVLSCVQTVRNVAMEHNSYILLNTSALCRSLPLKKKVIGFGYLCSCVKRGKHEILHTGGKPFHP